MPDRAGTARLPEKPPRSGRHGRAARGPRSPIRCLARSGRTASGACADPPGRAGSVPRRSPGTEAVSGDRVASARTSDRRRARTGGPRERRSPPRARSSTSIGNPSGARPYSPIRRAGASALGREGPKAPSGDRDRASNHTSGTGRRRAVRAAAARRERRLPRCRRGAGLRASPGSGAETLRSGERRASLPRAPRRRSGAASEAGGSGRLRRRAPGPLRRSAR